MNEIGKAVLQAIARRDGELETIQEVYEEAAEDLPAKVGKESVRDALHGLVREGHVDAKKQSRNYEGGWDIEGPYWVNREQVPTVLLQ
jgi:hypothetical protein